MNSSYLRNVPSLVTEDQAETHKVCPLTLATEDSHNCIGSRCSAWNWEIWPQRFGAAPREPVGCCGIVPTGYLFPVGRDGNVWPIEEKDFLDFS